MAIKRYVAPTTREAMMQVRRELGDDAVIIANRRVGNRIEILAAAPDAVEALVERSEARADQRAVPAREPQPQERAVRGEARPKVEPFQDFVRRQMQTETGPQPARATARDLNTPRAGAARPAQTGSSAVAMYQDVAQIEDDTEFAPPKERASQRAENHRTAEAPARRAARPEFASDADPALVRAERAASQPRAHRAAQIESDDDLPAARNGAGAAQQRAQRAPQFDSTREADAVDERTAHAASASRSHRAPQLEAPVDPAVFRRRPAHVAPIAQVAAPRVAPALPPVDIVLEPATPITVIPAAQPLSGNNAVPIASGHAAVPTLPMRSQAAPIATAARLREASIAAQAARAQAAAQAQMAAQANAPVQASVPAQASAQAAPASAVATAPAQAAAPAQAPVAAQPPIPATHEAPAVTPPAAAAQPIAATPSTAASSADAGGGAQASQVEAQPAAESANASTANVAPTAPAVTTRAVEPVALALPKTKPTHVATSAAEAANQELTAAPVVQVAPIAPAMLVIESRADAPAWDMPFAKPVSRSMPRTQPAPATINDTPLAAAPAQAQVQVQAQAQATQPAAVPAPHAAESELLAELRSMRDSLREQIASLAAKPAAAEPVAAAPEVSAEAAPAAATETAPAAIAEAASPDAAVTPPQAAHATAPGAVVAPAMPLVQSGTGVRVMTRLLTAGFSADVARRIASHVPAQTDPQQAEEWLQDVITHNIRCIEPGAGIVERSGRPGSVGQVFALIGPTGVGKTTTVAKLAARFAVRHGTSALGLITLDAYRVAAPEQLRAYGRILGTPVHLAEDATTLRELLATMVHKRLVLIDTCGLSQRDDRLGEMLDLLAAAGSPTRPIQRVLLMNSASHAETLDDAARAWRATECTGAILTKLDEAARIGGSLDATLRHRLTLLGITNGQRVPEDWHAANSRLLAHLALKPAAQLFDLADEEGAALVEATTFNSAFDTAHD